MLGFPDPTASLCAGTLDAKSAAVSLGRTGPQAPCASPRRPGDRFRRDSKIAGQIGKPAEQGRCLPKNGGSKLCLSLFTCSVMFGGVTPPPPASSVTPAATEQRSSGIWAELVETAETRELVELEPGMDGCPFPPQRNPSCLYKIHVPTPVLSNPKRKISSCSGSQVSQVGR